MNDETASVDRLLEAATAQITAALGLEKREARIEARALAVHAWQVDTAWLIAHDTDQPNPTQSAAFKSRVSRRLTGEPVAYIVGEREFFGRMFKVSPDVLIPRPETELLVEAALEQLPADQPINVLDVGTGSGCIGITLALERPNWTVSAADLSIPALAVAKANAHQWQAPVTFHQSDLLLDLANMRFDLIVSNPPYIADDDSHLQSGDVRFEPRLALATHNQGMALLERLVHTAPAHLQPGGWLMLEHGFAQANACQQAMREQGYARIATRMDLAGHGRVTLGCAEPTSLCDHPQP